MCGINVYRVPCLDCSVRKEELWRLREGVHELALPAENKPKPWPLRPLTDRSTVPLRAFCLLFRKKGTLLPYPFFLLCFQCPWLYFFWYSWSPLYTDTLFKLHPHPAKTFHSYFRKRVHLKFCSLLTFLISCHDVGDRYEL